MLRPLRLKMGRLRLRVTEEFLCATQKMFVATIATQSQYVATLCDQSNLCDPKNDVATLGDPKKVRCDHCDSLRVLVCDFCFDWFDPGWICFDRLDPSCL